MEYVILVVLAVGLGIYSWKTWIWKGYCLSKIKKVLKKTFNNFEYPVDRASIGRTDQFGYSIYYNMGEKRSTENYIRYKNTIENKIKSLADKSVVTSENLGNVTVIKMDYATIRFHFNYNIPDSYKEFYNVIGISALYDSEFSKKERTKFVRNTLVFIISAFVLCFGFNLAMNAYEEWKRVDYLNVVIDPGETYAIENERILKYGTVDWENNNNKICSVDDNTIIGNSSGAATLTASYNGRPIVRIDLTVNTIPLEKIEIKESSYSTPVNKGFGIGYTYSPNNAETSSIIWESSDEKVATVDKGYVTPKNVGTTTITMSTRDGLKSSCVVTVENMHGKISSIDELISLIEEYEEANWEKQKSYEDTIYHMPRAPFIEYISENETPVITADNKGGYYDDPLKRYRDLDHEIQSDGDIVDSKWTYYGDFAVEKRDTEYVDVDDYYKIKNYSTTNLLFKGEKIGLCFDFVNNRSSMRYVDSRFMTVKGDNVIIDCVGGGLTLILED